MVVFPINIQKTECRVNSNRPVLYIWRVSLYQKAQGRRS